MNNRILVSVKTSRILDSEAQNEWGFNVFALVEAAGRLCASAFAEACPDFFKGRPRVTVVSGTGNNGADAMVMLRSWILSGFVEPAAAAVVVSRLPKQGESGPRAELLASFKKMKVSVLVWDGDLGEAVGRASGDIIAQSDIIVDGIAGTGLDGALHGAALEMADAVNSRRGINGKHPDSPSPLSKRPFVVSVDIPSGLSDGWEPEMPAVRADLTLSIEPQKYCIYTPGARPYAGKIKPVSGIFPEGLIAKHGGAELLDWKSARRRVTKMRPEIYKHERGIVEIRAGSRGASGAALISARGAQAAGAGLVNLVVDEDVYSVLAPRASGIMVRTAKSGSAPDELFEGRWKPNAILLGPGWGVSEDRKPVLEKALALEKTGTPLVLDADAIELCKNHVFGGSAILTPHPGELCRFTGIEKRELFKNPEPALLKYSHALRAVILFKGHIITIAAPDGRFGIIDGMAPVLAAGGSGDLLAGFCAAIAARTANENVFDAYTCAAAGAALLIASGKSKKLKRRFSDPLEFADRAAELAGKAWLGE